MSSLLRKCCLYGCASCFFGIKYPDPLDPADNAVACGHNIDEKLELKVPRPAYSSGVLAGGVTQTAGPPCTCIGDYQTFNYAPASPDIEVEYAHFHERDPDRVYTWRYQHALNDGGVFPPCEIPCCGYTGTTYNDYECCNDQYYCANGYRVNTLSGTKQASGTQQTLINTGVVPEKVSSIHAASCDYGQQYFFLQGICNYSSSTKFRHWFWNNNTQDVEETTSTTLESTLLCVVHKEKWWDRGYNSMENDPNNPLSPPVGSIDDTAAPYRTPKYWLFACAGIQLFTWEIMLLSSLSISDKKDLFKAIHDGTFVREEIFDTLEADGILEIKDHGRSDGKMIRKTMRSTNAVDVEDFFFSRPGGWDFVCFDFAQYPPGTADLEAKWPQIPRRSRYNMSSGQTYGNSCFTGAPIPTNGAYQTQAFQPVTPGDQPCNVLGVGACANLPSGCQCGTFSFCGSPDAEDCFIDTIVGNCKGCWIQYVQYGTVGSGQKSSCLGVFNSFLCRVPDLSTQCDFGELPNEITHQIPYVVSNLGRQTVPVPTLLCCDGTASVNVSPLNITCPALYYDSTVECEDPTEWGPDI